MYAYGPASQSLPMATELVARQLVTQLLCRSSRYIASQTYFMAIKTIILPSSSSVLCAVFCTRASLRASASRHTVRLKKAQLGKSQMKKYDYLQRGSHVHIRIPPIMYIQYGGSITNQYEFMMMHVIMTVLHYSRVVTWQPFNQCAIH